MANDRVVGGLIFVGSLCGIAVYFWLLFMSPWAWRTVQVSAFLLVGMGMVIMAWIGYTLATTPPPMSLEGFDFETEIGGSEESEEPNEAGEEQSYE